MKDYHLYSYETYRYVNGHLIPTTKYVIIEDGTLKEYETELFSFTGVLLRNRFNIPTDDEIKIIMKHVDSSPMSGFSNLKIIRTI